MNKEKLKKLAKAYEIANENDYCTSEVPECEGLRPDEIANRIIFEINSD